MPNITINAVEYEMVNTLADDMSSTNVLKTIVEEGETSVNSYRLNLPPFNPTNQHPFINSQEIEDFCLDSPQGFWSVYFDDPVEEETKESE